MFPKTKSTVVAAAAGVLFIGGTAAAEIHDMGWTLNGAEIDLFAIGDVEDNGDGSNIWSGGDYEANPAFTVNSYACTSYLGSSDGGGGFIDAEFEVTNNSNATQTFQLLMTLAVGPIGPLTERNGSVAATVTNNQFDGDAMIAAASGGSIYRAFTDLVDPFVDPPAATLWDDPYSLVASGPFATADDNTDFSAVAGGAVTNTISIMFEFELSAGDSASVSGLFQVATIPAPGALALLGLAGLAGRRRRR